MSRKRNALLGLSADIGGMIFVQLLSLALIPLYLKYISLTDYGYWLVISSIMGWIGLADFGIGFAVTRFFIKAMNGAEKDGVNRIANTSLFLFLLISFVFIVAGVALYPFFQQWLHIPDKVFKIFTVAFFLTLLNSTIVIPFSIFVGILEARQKIALNRNIQTVSLIAQLLLSIILVMGFKNIIGLAVSLLAGTLLNCCLLIYFSRRELRFNLSASLISRRMLKELFSFGGYFQLGRTANILATSTDNLFIAGYLDAARVPVYNFTSRLPVLFCNTVASKVPAALFSGLSQVFDQENQLLFRQTFQKLFAIMVRIAFFTAIVILFINEKFITLWVGRENFGGTYLNLIFVYWVFFETIIRGTGLVIQVYGDLKMWAISSIIESVINIGLSFYFLSIGWNIAGLALATAIARTVTIGVYWAWFIHNKQLLSFTAMIGSLFTNLLKNIPLLAVLYCLSRYWNFGRPLPELILYCVIALIVNLIFYDWNILYGAFRKRSFRFLYESYMKKY